MGRVGGGVTLAQVRANVKLDDLVAPDDNTDLDAVTAQHGLFAKLLWDKLDAIAAAADVTGSNPPQAHGHLTVADTQVFSAIPPAAWTDLNLSSVVGSQVTLVMLKITSNQPQEIAVRRNGDTDEFHSVTRPTGTQGVELESARYAGVLVCTDSAGRIELKADGASGTTVIDVMAYIKVGV